VIDDDVLMVIVVFSRCIYFIPSSFPMLSFYRGRSRNCRVQEESVVSSLPESAASRIAILAAIVTIFCYRMFSLPSILNFQQGIYCILLCLFHLMEFTSVAMFNPGLLSVRCA
jgi:hypothetical protein